MTKCWALHNGTVITLSADDQQTCGSTTSGAQFCCYSGDTCLEDSICQYTHPLVGGSGYYIGLCTDPSFPEPCSKSCSDVQLTDIVFTDPSTSLWACCYQYVGADRDCSNPGNETFYAPSPESLTAQAEPSPTTPSSETSSINSSITLSSTPSVSASVSTSTSTPLTTTPTLPTSILASSTTTTHSPPSALSTGAKAGIGIAASTAGLGISLMLGFYLFRKRRAGRYQEAPTANVAEKMASLPPTSVQRQAVLEKSSEQHWELGGNGRSEMDGRGRGEMEAGR
ncbi:hypothetical protein BDR22DRAFT_850365 [Usnea florida]